MKFVIYSLYTDQDYGTASYLKVFDNFQDAWDLKEKLSSTGYCFDGSLFVGTDCALDEFDKVTFYNSDKKHIKEFYPELHTILIENNYFE